MRLLSSDVSTNRRDFLALSAAAVAAGVVAQPTVFGDEEKLSPKGQNMAYGLVTYMWGAEWTLDELLDRCVASGVRGVELRTTHRHGVEPTLTATERRQVAKKFESVILDLIAIDLWPFRIQQIKVQALTTQECPACHLGKYDYLSSARLSLTTELCGQKSVQITPPHPAKCDLDQLSQQWKRLGAVERSPFFLRFRTAEWVMTLFPDGRAIIEGISDVALARSIYTQLVGM